MLLKKIQTQSSSMTLSESHMSLAKGGYILTCEEKKHFSKTGVLVSTEVTWKMVEDGCPELTEIIDVTGRKLHFPHKPKKITTEHALSLIGTM
jgi:hypothetical protein